jgi:succinate dehydrogenase / fumarate reductase membrane anchor subunit
MAVETGAPAAPPSSRPDRVVGAYTGRDRPAGGWELWTWLFMRISGIVLLVLAVGHVLIMHVVGKGVSRVNFGFVATRWQSPFWRSWDWALLSLALLHGINGLRVIVQDYARYPWLRFAINMAFYVIGFTLFVLGTVIVFTFDPSRWPGVS